jgi:hypothetical protein
VTLGRLKRLRLAFLALVPAAVAATLIMAAYTPVAGDDGKALEVPVPVMIAMSERNVTVLTSSQWSPACLGSPVQALLYRESSAGIGEAATFPTPGCQSMRLLLLDRTTVLKVL